MDEEEERAEDVETTAGESGLPHDDLAGVVDLFGALTRAELDRALAELAARQGSRAAADVAGALEGYHLVAVDPASGAVEVAEGGVPSGDEGEEFLTVGPVAFPTLPPGAEDLPHVLDVGPRVVDRASIVGRVEERLRGDAARAVAAGDVDRMRHLLDVTYDLETWAADTDVGDVRERLDDALDAPGGGTGAGEG